MSTKPRRRIAILGAGPIGLEAALYAGELGHDVRVFERGRVAENVRAWGHVTLFSPWRMNRSSLGARRLATRGFELPPDAACPTGAEYVAGYLAPLAASLESGDRIHERHTAVRVGRDRIAKADLVGGPRGRHPFRILLDRPDGECVVTADVVLDCTGTYGHPNWMGNGNVPACGERELRDRIDYLIEDVAGSARPRFAGRRVLLVGSGHSAATALEALATLEGTRVVWAARSDRFPPLSLVENDPLPGRDRLSRRANALAAGVEPRVEFRPATSVESVAAEGEGFRVSLSTKQGSETLRVDRVLALVGYDPDNSIYRELQVHECYASFGPMKLAASLQDSDATDCLAAGPAGAETLRNPEPDFFILGAKSYGRRSNFLIRTGLDQIREAFSLIEDDPDLDLYTVAAAPAAAKEP